MFNLISTLAVVLLIQLIRGQFTVGEDCDVCHIQESLSDQLRELKNMVKNLKDEPKNNVCPSVTMVRRILGGVDFNRNWMDYKNGFGDEAGDMWLGLEEIHQLTWNSRYGVKITMEAWDGKAFWAYYSMFSVGPESDNYRLSVSGYDNSSTAPNELNYHDGMAFSTYDKRNDNRKDKSCNAAHSGAWWYNACHNVHPTGIYFPGGVTSDKGLCWDRVPGYPPYYSFKTMTFTLIPN